MVAKARSNLATTSNISTKNGHDYALQQNPVAAALSVVDLEDDRLPLLSYEQNLMVDTFIEDVVFVAAK